MPEQRRLVKGGLKRRRTRWRRSALWPLALVPGLALLALGASGLNNPAAANQRDQAAAFIAEGLALVVVIPALYAASRRPRVTVRDRTTIIRDATGVRNAWIVVLAWMAIGIPLTLIHVPWWAVAGPIGVAALAALWRSTSVALFIREPGVTVRNLFRTHRRSWSDIEEIRFVNVPGFQIKGRGGSFYGAVFRTRDHHEIDVSASYGYLGPRSRILQELHEWARRENVSLTARPNVLTPEQVSRYGVRVIDTAP